ncbi:MAG: ATP-grasp domain-containing protein [Halobacteriales archaeon]|nr:ATP-grasp domain-containing protein [Halobacteriales archaeon]
MSADIRLAVATNAETLARIREPLADRGITADHVAVSERTLPLDGSLGAFDVGFVFPSRLMEGGVADAMLDVPWVNSREDILRSRNKAGVLARLSATDVSTPQSVLVSNPVSDTDLEAVWERFDPPVVVKPNSTTRGTGIAKVSDFDSLLGVTDYLDLVHDYRATGDRSYLIQEYLPDARDYRVMTIDGEYVGAVERRLPDAALAEGRWKHNVHRGAEATGVDLDAELQQVAERAARTLDIDWLGVDILVTDEGAVVNETNARPTVDTAMKYESDFYDRLAELIRSR